jgi:hypothetical protein
LPFMYFAYLPPSFLLPTPYFFIHFFLVSCHLAWQVFCKLSAKSCKYCIWSEVPIFLWNCFLNFWILLSCQFLKTNMCISNIPSASSVYQISLFD